MSVAEEFFGERELVINATSGTEYLSSLSELFAATPTLDQGGLTPAPFEEGEARYFFRGQTDSRHGLNSSLFRTLIQMILMTRHRVPSRNSCVLLRRACFKRRASRALVEI